MFSYFRNYFRLELLSVVNCNLPDVTRQSVQVTVTTTSSSSSSSSSNFSSNTVVVSSVKQAPITLGQLTYSARWERHDLNTRCFKVFNVWHINLEIYSQARRQELFNLHFAWWQENGRWRFGLWEPRAYNWCWSKCGPSWDDLKRGFIEGIKAGADSRNIQAVSWAFAVALAAFIILALFAVAV